MNKLKNGAPLIAIFRSGTSVSVEAAFRAVGARTVISNDREIIRKAGGLVMPGQGNFPVGMELLKNNGLIDEMERARQSGKAILGICLGMQMMFDSSTEGQSDGNVTAGLGWIKGRVTQRSEEHTSELQSLMRISYAVFCLKKKNNT